MSDPIEDANDTVGVGGQNSNDNTITTVQGDANATTMVEQNNNTTTAVTATTSTADRLELAVLSKFQLDSIVVPCGIQTFLLIK